jgi:glycosyltransferase involved in cell wall biosynthesis
MPETQPLRVFAVDLDTIASGGQYSFATLLTELARQDDLEVRVLTGEGPIAQAYSDPTISLVTTSQKLTSVSLRPRELVSTLRSLWGLVSCVRSEIRQYRPDVIHANSARSGVVALLAAASGHPPLVVHIRDHFRPSVTARLARAALLYRSAAVIAVSRYTAKRFEMSGLREVDVVYNAIHPERFARTLPPSTRRVELGDDREGRIVLGIVGQLIPRKGQDIAIQALARVRSGGVDAVLWLVGEEKRLEHMGPSAGGFANRLHELTAELDLTDHVRFVGETRDVSSLIGDMDILLIPSRDEPFGRTFLEATALDVPTIVTSESGLSEIVTHGVSSIVLPPSDPEPWAEAIMRLSRDRPGRLELTREAALAAGATFRPDVHAARVRSIYSRILARSASEESLSVDRS